MKRIVAIEQYCIGCRLCEIHCQVQHSGSQKMIQAFREEQDIMHSRVHVEESERVSFALQCRHCSEASCMEACMSGALYRDHTTGAVLCDEERCVGCWMCIMVCPVGAVRQGKDRKVASKCDLCLDAAFPVCVANCPNEAIILQICEKHEMQT